MPDMATEFEKHPLKYLGENMGVAGLVLIWRGIWYGLDAIDLWLFAVRISSRPSSA